MNKLFKYADSTVKEVTDFFETRVGKLKDKKKTSGAAKKKKEKKNTKKRKRVYSNFSVAEFSEDIVVGSKSTAFYMENIVILQINARI